MSDDLISRRKAIENLHKILKIWNGNECLVSFRTVIDYMNSQANTYDVYKVIEKLKTELSLADKEKGRCARENPLQFDMAKGYAQGISVALEIVKSGGGAYD